MEDEVPASSSNKTIMIFVALVIVAALAVGVLVLSKDKSSDTTKSTTQTPSTSQSTDNASNKTTSASYKDGQYSATGSYQSPGGEEKITIAITVKDGAVTDTSATQGAVDPQGEQYQQQFIAGYKQQVVGKKLSELSLSHVSGSSLTPKGFNDAIEQIRRQAQA